MFGFVRNHPREDGGHSILARKAPSVPHEIVHREPLPLPWHHHAADGGGSVGQAEDDLGHGGGRVRTRSEGGIGENFHCVAWWEFRAGKQQAVVYIDPISNLVRFAQIVLNSILVRFAQIVLNSNLMCFAQIIPNLNFKDAPKYINASPPRTLRPCSSATR